MNADETAAPAQHNSVNFQLVVFAMGGQQYAVKITLVREILNTVHITPAPRMPWFCPGIINLRGDIIPVFDFRRYLRLERPAGGTDDVYIILSYGGLSFCVIADSVIDTVKTPEKGLVRLEVRKECIQGFVQLGSRMILVLNPDDMMAAVEAEIAVIAEAGR
ncbi:MAG: chemotaxis protein CheW [Elusimicrobiaceae bacterium]|nr:chemotaxis protein CheW [Elusimicrobiaceae bacterium]